eukprot:m.308350 g.308350  ORF g.308350 m.308350 type:complete len:190 (+) comp27404_c0_seq18:432-1001(+)
MAQTMPKEYAHIKCASDAAGIDDLAKSIMLTLLMDTNLAKPIVDFLRSKGCGTIRGLVDLFREKRDRFNSKMSTLNTVCGDLDDAVESQLVIFCRAACAGEVEHSVLVPAMAGAAPASVPCKQAQNWRRVQSLYLDEPCPVPRIMQQVFLTCFNKKYPQFVWAGGGGAMTSQTQPQSQVQTGCASLHSC